MFVLFFFPFYLERSAFFLSALQLSVTHLHTLQRVSNMGVRTDTLWTFIIKRTGHWTCLARSFQIGDFLPVIVHVSISLLLDLDV